MNNLCKSIGAGLCIAASVAMTQSATANIDIVFDYTYDANGFFNTGSTFADGSNGATRRARLEEAATYFEMYFEDSLDAIVPGGGNTWSQSFSNPATGGSTLIDNPAVGQDQIVIYAGGRNMSALGRGGPGGWGGTGNASWFDTIGQRGQAETTGASAVDFAPWGGSLTFDTDIVVNYNGSNLAVDWFWGDASSSVPVQTANTDSVVYDFLSVAIHEIGHVLGFGTSDSFDNLISTDLFTGANSVAEYGGNVPVESASGHWLDDLDGGIHAMDPTIANNQRKMLTDLDYAGFADIGWQVNIPEPSSLLLLTLGAAAMIRRKTA
ncbi:hypothetical protein KS4_24080 [Poriferisphaera corsica]|uniref:Ice-binding protein C-terminal domain-containing protein n=1 Tax=Poriferisphaera corsica TaxID=2528020 RepID=A0A517YVU8_9BACT|nr:PEP-CTERM sorting domain-containing protein [Poriferisphaera corsica]QDU34340.1 hypothetical protein KS4_24080 [Poriferisphaera corsica]